MYQDLTFTNSIHAIHIVCFQEETPKFFDMNAAFEELIGYSREQLLFNELRSIYHPDFLKRVPTILDRFSNREQIITQGSYIGKNNQRLEVELQITKIFHEGKRMVATVVRDVSEADWFLKELRENARVLATGLLDCDNKIFNITKYTGCTGHLSKINIKQHEDVSLFHFVYHDDFLNLQKCLKKIRSTKTAVDCEFRYFSPKVDGLPKAVIRFFPILNGSGNIMKIAFSVSPVIEDSRSKQDISLRLRLLMSEKKWTNESLSQKTGLSLGTISKIKNGKNLNPTKKTINKIFKVLEADKHLQYSEPPTPQA